MHCPAGGVPNCRAWCRRVSRSRHGACSCQHVPVSCHTFLWQEVAAENQDMPQGEPIQACACSCQHVPVSCHTFLWQEVAAENQDMPQGEPIQASRLAPAAVNMCQCHVILSFGRKWLLRTKTCRRVSRSRHGACSCQHAPVSCHTFLWQEVAAENQDMPQGEPIQAWRLQLSTCASVVSYFPLAGSGCWEPRHAPGWADPGMAPAAVNMCQCHVILSFGRRWLLRTKTCRRVSRSRHGACSCQHVPVSCHSFLWQEVAAENQDMPQGEPIQASRLAPAAVNMCQSHVILSFGRKWLLRTKTCRRVSRSRHGACSCQHVPVSCHTFLWQEVAAENQDMPQGEPIQAWRLQLSTCASVMSYFPLAGSGCWEPRHAAGWADPGMAPAAVNMCQCHVILSFGRRWLLRTKTCRRVSRSRHGACSCQHVPVSCHTFLWQEVAAQNHAWLRFMVLFLQWLTRPSPFALHPLTHLFCAGRCNDLDSGWAGCPCSSEGQTCPSESGKHWQSQL